MVKLANRQGIIVSIGRSWANFGNSIMKTVDYERFGTFDNPFENLPQLAPQLARGM